MLIKKMINIGIKNKKLATSYSPRTNVQVQSALKSLTSVFGMGTGVASSLSSPAILTYLLRELVLSKLHNGHFLIRGEVLDLLVLVR